MVPAWMAGDRPVTGVHERPSNVLIQKSVCATITCVGPVTVMVGSTVMYSMPCGGRGAELPKAQGRSRPEMFTTTMVSLCTDEPPELPVTSAPGAEGRKLELGLISPG